MASSEEAQVWRNVAGMPAIWAFSGVDLLKKGVLDFSCGELIDKVKLERVVMSSEHLVVQIRI